MNTPVHSGVGSVDNSDAPPHHLGPPLLVASERGIQALTISEHGILAVSTYDSIVQLWDRGQGGRQ